MPYTKQNPTTGDTITQTMLRAMETQYEEAIADMAVIASIQRGTITLADTVPSNTATITSVDTDKAKLNFLGYTTDTPAKMPRIALTNGTTITATASQGGGTCIVSWEVIEYA